ncbi:hypothetical protein ACRWXJ_13630, partial [Escherichia coli]
VGEGKLMTHDEPCSMAPDDKHDLISGTCSHLPLLCEHVTFAVNLWLIFILGADIKAKVIVSF